jgi:hypothetical protein
MLGIVGTLALGAALLTHIAERRGLGTLAGGLVLVVATFPAVEYDTDVPQFDPAEVATSESARIAATSTSRTGPRAGVAKLLAGATLYGAMAALVVATLLLLGPGCRRLAARG